MKSQRRFSRSTHRSRTRAAFPSRFPDKARARKAVWDRLAREGVARFPFPPHGRIPNFAGAAEAAARLFQISIFRTARCLKINPDAPQRPVREFALRRGITILVPTPRLRAGFRRFDPREIPPECYAEAASLSKGARWGELLPLTRLPRIDAVVVGSVAVTRRGHRCGKGEGYADLEYAVLRELGHPAVPVATTIHPLQILEEFPRDPFDLPLTFLVTPQETIRVHPPLKGSTGIDWDRLTDEQFEAMPLLRELRGFGYNSRRAPVKRRT
ncbi:MAG: 5-formyltetrahydrofolate cyclo-ligase [Nitrospirae bacterium]|nr:MAG: 5-formyltetrahydrofolate cyclo-ligase [Nitrospirota bacterium]